MSQENIELHERAIETLNARALSDELAAETLAPGFRIENAVTAVTDKTYYGAEGVREWFRDIFEGLDEDARYETEEILADSEDFGQCDAGGFVAHVGAIGEVVSAKLANEKLVEKRGLVAGTSRGIKDCLVGTFQCVQFARDYRKRFLPGDFLVMITTGTQDDRMS